MRKGFTLIDPRLRGDDNKVEGFTLIELLVVIAILAVLAVVVVLTLNPAGLLQEARDNNRISDMATLNSAIGYSLADNAAESLGTANTVYVSIADPSATSTAGDQCQGLSLLALPSGYSYHCAASSTYRQTNANGWIPVALQNNTFGSSLAQLPIDPTNTSSSRLYYTYETDGNGKFEVTSAMESAKYQLGGTDDVISGDGGTLASVYEKGSKLGLEPLDYGDSSLVGLWTFDEGANAIAYDYSGNNATGSLSSPAPTWVSGKVGSGALSFNGTNNAVSVSGTVATGPMSVAAWINMPDVSGASCSGGGARCEILHAPDDLFEIAGGSEAIYGYSFNTPQWVVAGTVTNNTWYQVAYTYDKTTVRSYVNGTQAGSTVAPGVMSPTGALSIGSLLGTNNRNFNGLIDDVRIYNRALSAPQIQAMYAGGK